MNKKVFLGSVIGFGLLVYYVIIAINTSLEAEKTLHATHFALDLVEQYVIKYSERPKSWDDLRSINIEPRVGFEWPRDMAKIQQRVAIDFSLNFDDLATKPVSYRAIDSIGPTFYNDDD